MVCDFKFDYDKIKREGYVPNNNNVCKALKQSIRFS